MNSVEMSKAIRARAQQMRDCDDVGLPNGVLADNAELLLVLARIIDGKPLLRAFGSPGDWGYSHPIGRALAAAAEAADLEPPAQRLDEIRSALLVVLDCVDYTSGNCSINEMVGAVLPKECIASARQAVRQ